MNYISTNFFRQLLPDRQITIVTEDTSFSLKFRTKGQIFAGIGFLCIVSWAAFSSVSAISSLTSDNKHNFTNLHFSDADSEDSLMTREQLLSTIMTLEKQVSAALHLSRLASEDKKRLKSELAELTSGDIQKSKYSVANSTLASGSFANPLNLYFDQYEYIISSLEDAVVDRNKLKTELNKLKSINEELLFETDLKQEKARRTAAQLADAVLLASKGLEKIYNQFGVNPVNVAKEIETQYSGAGGASLFSSNLTSDDVDDNYFHKEDLLKIESAIKELNTRRIAYESLPLGNPVRSLSRFTSGYGNRMHPVHGRPDFHAGVDFAAPTGTDIHATASGKVIFTGRKGAYGKTVVIRHLNGVETLYAHLSKIRVKRNDIISRGQIIGDMGSTGQSTGPHLHYEVRVNKKSVNPMKYIKAR